MVFLEPGPWPTLTLVVSLEAILLSTFVMIGQNRVAAFQPAKADHEFVEQETELRTNTESTSQIHVMRGVWVRGWTGSARGFLGADDGIVSAAALVVGVAGATSATGPIFTAGIAGLSAGAVSMALGEDVSVSSQRDAEPGQLAQERRELRESPDEELAALYEAKGQSRSTAHLLPTSVGSELRRGQPQRLHGRRSAAGRVHLPQGAAVPPRDFGYPSAVVGRGVDEVIEPGRAIVAAMGIEGFANVEVKRDVRDGHYKVMGVNGCPNTSGALAVRCEVDFPLITYAHLVDGTVLPQPRRAEGVHWIDEIAEVRGVAARWLDGGLSVRDGVAPYLARRVFAVSAAHDPGPFAARLAVKVAPRVRVR